MQGARALHPDRVPTAPTARPGARRLRAAGSEGLLSNRPPLVGEHAIKSWTARAEDSHRRTRTPRAPRGTHSEQRPAWVANPRLGVRETADAAPRVGARDGGEEVINLENPRVLELGSSRNTRCRARSPAARPSPKPCSPPAPRGPAKQRAERRSRWLLLRQGKVRRLRARRHKRDAGAGAGPGLHSTTPRSIAVASLHCFTAALQRVTDPRRHTACGVRSLLDRAGVRCSSLLSSEREGKMKQVPSKQAATSVPA